MRIDVLDDWADVARTSADWATLEGRAEVVIHKEPLNGPLPETRILLPMRERMILDGDALAGMPKLEMIALTGNTTRHLDLDVIRARGITLCWSGAYYPEETAEFTLALMLAAEKRIPQGASAMFMEGTGLGRRLSGRRMGIVGLGRIGTRFARMAQAMDMEVVAWSRSLTGEKAASAGVTRVSLPELFATSDIVSIQLTLNDDTRGMVGADLLGAMPPDALLVNTSRGPIVQEQALIAALRTGRIRAALDVFDVEPLPRDHPFRTMSNVTLAPHMGYATQETMAMFYGECIENILNWLDGRPSRVLET